MQQTALMTGASRGLGLALARALAERGWRLIIDARGAAALAAARAELAERTEVIAVRATYETHSIARRWQTLPVPLAGWMPS